MVNIEPLLPKYLGLKIDNFHNVVGDYIKLYNGGAVDACYGKDMHYPILGGVETDDSKLKTITISINNWEREYYIPYIIDMYYFQDYPKELLEVIVTDEDSEHKNDILVLMKSLAQKYQGMKIRHIQLNENRFQNGCTRANTGIRFATNEIVISNASDSIPLGNNFLRGVCYTHNLRDRLYCMPMAYCTPHGTAKHAIGLHSIQEVFEQEIIPHWRRGHDYVTSVETKIAQEMHGFTEKAFWGGIEGNFVNRFIYGGGLIHANTAIMSMELINYPIGYPNRKDAKHKFDREWTNTYIQDYDMWGITDIMQEYDLYE